ncbi:hypothetical protein JYT86_00480 [bacterium AH-315-N03]|nr:hypothetical protein [bacterium AH-315-N03]
MSGLAGLLAVATLHLVGSALASHAFGGPRWPFVVAALVVGGLAFWAQWRERSVKRMLAGAALGVGAWLVLATLDARGTFPLEPSSEVAVRGPGRLAAVRIRTNQLGLRGAIPPRTEGRLRVVLAGAPTFSSLVGDDATLARTLEATLRRRGLEADVFGAALPGIDTRLQIELLREHAAALDAGLIVYLHRPSDDRRPLARYESPRAAAVFPLAAYAAERSSSWPAPTSLEELGELSARVLLVYETCPATVAPEFAHAVVAADEARHLEEGELNARGVRRLADELAPMITQLRRGEEEGLADSFGRQCAGPPEPEPEPDDDGSLAESQEPSLIGGVELMQRVGALLAPHRIGERVGDGWFISGVRMSPDHVDLELRIGSDVVALRLTHPSASANPRWQSQSFAIEVVTRIARSRIPDGTLEELAAAIVRNDEGGFWSEAP